MTQPCTVVMYHYVRDTERTPYPAISALSVADFSRQLDRLQAQAEIIDYPTFCRLLFGGEEKRTPTALLTFDDGFIDHVQTVLPLLKERGLSGVFFVSDASLDERPERLLMVHRTHFLLAKLGAERFAGEVRRLLREQPVASDTAARPGTYRYDIPDDGRIKRFLNYELPFDEADRLLDCLFRDTIGDPASFARDLYLSRRMVREMAAAGMTIGGHTRCHRVLSRLDVSEQEQELQAAVRQIQSVTEQESVPFCYPFGHPHTYNADTLRLLRELGYGVAFTTVRASVEFGKHSPYELPRYDTRDLPS